MCFLEKLILMIILLLFLEPEIATPPLTGIILPGVTRSSLLQIGKTWVSVIL